MPAKHTFICSLVGETIERWTVLRLSERARYVVATCACSPLIEREVLGASIVHGRSKSCGCLPSAVVRTHGRSKTKEYKAWKNLIKRCNQTEGYHHERYRLRGIDVCAEWRTSFEAFFTAMGPMPSPKHTVERIDNDAAYGPENCRWATVREQARNRTSNRLLTFRGETLCVAEWSDRTGIRPGVICQRMDRDGWSVERALTVGARIAAA